MQKTLISVGGRFTHMHSESGRVGSGVGVADPGERVVAGRRGGEGDGVAKTDGPLRSVDPGTGRSSDGTGHTAAR